MTECPKKLKEGTCIGAKNYPNCICTLKDRITKPEQKITGKTYIEINLKPRTCKMRKW
ncbi:MAG: hypothetical protein WC389_10350 [Lutibacter sp.]|jgi:hypothetical protein